MKQARFMGRMAATVCHDLSNVLATVQQASGLLGDYLALARKESLKTMGLRPKFKYDAKFGEIIGQIQAQVDRGQDLCEHLSRLAHSPDEGQKGTDLYKSCTLLAGLAGRACRKHKVGLTVSGEPGAAVAGVTQIEALTALEAALLGLAWECRERGDIVLGPGADGDRVYVDFLCAALGPGEARSLAGSLGGGQEDSYLAQAIDGGVRLAFPKA
jgi:signal transduction histidine kinase